MKVGTVFLKTLREMSRDLWMLGLTLAFAPFFIYLYWLFTHGGSTTYAVVLVAPGQSSAQAVSQALAEVQYADGSPLLEAVLVDSQSEAEALVRARKAVAFIVLPPDFEARIERLRQGEREAAPQIVFGGDLTNPYYMVGATLSLGAVEGYIQAASSQSPLLRYQEQPLGASAARSEFELYVPGILVVAVILLVFLASMTVAREVEAGTLQRLRLSRMRAFDLLAGITAALLLVGLVSVLLTFLTALALGFRSQGSLWLAVVVCTLTGLSIIGIGLVVACFTRTVSQAFIVANFPLGFLMFLSGAIFPLPRVTLFSVGAYEFGLYDFLPATHAVAALNKIFTLGAGLTEIRFELLSLLALSLLYFALGVFLFQRTQMR